MMENKDNEGYDIELGGLLNKELGDVSAFQLEPENIIFSLENEEMLKITPDGFYVKGKLVSDDKEIYLGFKEWLTKANNFI